LSPSQITVLDPPVILALIAIEYAVRGAAGATPTASTMR
jgi:hypothetical protein